MFLVPGITLESGCPEFTKRGIRCRFCCDKVV